MNTTVADYTETIEIINGVGVKVYGGSKRPVRTLALTGHVTGWTKRNGARTTYAELTCTCHLVAELHHPEGQGTWITYGEDGWIDRLNELAVSHVENVTANAFMIRPAKGDQDRKADRRRVNQDELFQEMQVHGLRYSELMGHLEDLKAGHVLHAEDGTRFEIARDRVAYVGDTKQGLPIR